MYWLLLMFLVFLGVLKGSLLNTASLRGNVTTDDVPLWRGNPIIVALLIAIALGALASRWVNINRFSLHALYRNRIIRAFLGASHPERDETRNLFTDFDETDNVPVSSLWTLPGDPK